MDSQYRISVVIPTYGRGADVLRGLKSLQQQTEPAFEIIVVDNAADPELRRQVSAFNSGARVSARYVPEPRVGLHHARHAGARAASGEVLVFTDDDATFLPGWLKAYADAFEQHTDMSAAGGPVLPLWDAPPPDWLVRYMGTRRSFPVFSLIAPFPDFRLSPDEGFFGVNMAIRREVLFELGGFNPELIGRRTVGDGESGLNRGLREKGHLIGNVPQAIVYHHITEDRMTVKYIRKWAWHRGGAEMYRRWRGEHRTVWNIGRETLRIVRRYWRIWVADLIRPGGSDPESIAKQFRASLGWCELTYVWWMVMDPLVKRVLHQQGGGLSR